jgi:hypothetical protein
MYAETTVTTKTPYFASKRRQEIHRNNNLLATNTMTSRPSNVNVVIKGKSFKLMNQNIKPIVTKAFPSQS